MADSYECEKCERTFPSQSGLVMHKRWHNSKRKHKCPKCSAAFLSDVELGAHLNSSHSSTLKNVCPFCSKILETKDEYRNHLKDYHSMAYCFNCDKKFSCLKDLETHKSLYCDTSYTSENEEKVVYSRLEVHSNDKNNKCSFCSVVLNSIEELIEHSATHLRCHLCKSSKFKFKGLEHMRAHFMSIHRYFPCLWCHLIFESKSVLIRHFREAHINQGLDSRDPNLTVTQLIENVLSTKFIVLSLLFRQIEIKYPFYYLFEERRDWKREILKELRSNPRYSVSSDEQEISCKLDDNEEMIYVGENSLQEQEVTPCKLKKNISKSVIPDHILQLVYEEDNEEETGCPLVITDDERRKDELILNSCRKPWIVYGMCSLCGRLFADTESLQFHIDSGCSNNEKSISSGTSFSRELLKREPKCDFCKSSFKSFRDLVIHILDMNCSSVPSQCQFFVCLYCPTFLPGKDNLEHYRSKHCWKNLTKKGAFQCELCRQIFYDKTELKSHFTLEHVGDIWSCVTCQSQFIRLQDYENHVLSVHSQPSAMSLADTRSCSVCRLTFDTPEDKNLHLSTTTDHLVCWVCSEPFDSWNSLTNHFNTCVDHEDFFCSTCLKVFYEVRLKKIHFRLQHALGPSLSKSLKTIIIDVASLTIPIDEKKELLLKPSNKNYKCMGCSKEVAIYRCPVCFYPVHELEELYIHVEERRHPDLFCSTCFTSFLTLEGLKRHYYEKASHVPDHAQLLVTTSDSSANENFPSDALANINSLGITCNVCLENRIFASRIELRQHSERFHPDVFYELKCGPCKKIFVSKNLLLSHSSHSCLEKQNYE